MGKWHEKILCTANAMSTSVLQSHLTAMSQSRLARERFLDAAANPGLAQNVLSISGFPSKAWTEREVAPFKWHRLDSVLNVWEKSRERVRIFTNLMWWPSIALWVYCRFSTARIRIKLKSLLSESDAFLTYGLGG